MCEPWFCGSAQPRVTMLVVVPLVLDVHPDALVQGSRTRATDRLAAGAFAASRMVTSGMPEMCSGADNSGVTYSSRCCVAFAARLPALQAMLPPSTSVSCPASGSASDVNPPDEEPPACRTRGTASAAGFG